MIQAPPVVSPSELPSRERILHAAADLFLFKGFAETSVRDIARACGIKAASLYYHFDSKEAILAEALRLGVQATSDSFDDAISNLGEDATATDRFHAVIASHLTALFEGGPYTSLAAVVFPVAPPSVKEAVVPDRDAYEARWARLLGELATEGHIASDIDQSLTRLVLLGSLNCTLEWFDVTQEHTIENLAATMSSMFWLGLGHKL